MARRLRKLAMLLVVFLLVPGVLANTYIADLGFTLSQTVYTINDTIELKGNLYLSNYTTNGTLVTNHTGLAGASVNISIINTTTNNTASSYLLNTSIEGAFYSRSNYYSTATLILAPQTAGDYYVRANYTDPNNTSWWTQSEILVVNQIVNRLAVSADKISYNPSEAMSILVEAITEVGDTIIYTANVSINGTIRNSAKMSLSTFSCITGANGKCTATATAPSTYGNYFIEVNNFKAFSSFEVLRFDAAIYMKDELGQSIKHTFNTGEQASVEVGVITSSTAESYTFDGVIKNLAGAVVKSIDSTTLESNNSYTNRFTFTLDALNFQPGGYLVEVNVTKAGDGVVGAVTSFEVRSWDLTLKKKEVGSGFEYGYSAFPGRTVNLELYPAWRSNGSVIDSINTTSSMNITLRDEMNNQVNTSTASWNTSCGAEGCYEFSFVTPSNTGAYFISVIVSHSGNVQTLRKKIAVISVSFSSQSTDKDGSLKELFDAKSNAYISLSAKNSSADLNLSEARIVSVVHMNGTEYSYVEVTDFSSVNSTNDNLEWAWNTTLQRLKLDTPAAGGLYTVSITAENSTAAASARFIVNPYDVCLAAKTTAGQPDLSSYYYVYQFKTSDTVYFELKIVKADNPLGKAPSWNASGNSSYGMGSACTDLSATKQVVNNASITIEEATNMQSGKRFALNTTASVCQADDSSGGYTCTLQPIGNWDGGSYGVKFKIAGQDGQSDIAYAGFEARAFYLYAWSSTWQNKPTGTVSLTVDMYEAGNNWWGSYGSGGLDGTVTVEKIEYQGRQGEWLWPPIDYDYNVSQVNTSTITNGRGTLSLSASLAPTGQWKTGSYRAILKGTDSGGTSDYGYAWFSIRQWEVYAAPVDCSGGSCTSVYNINSKSNISLYVTIYNAGEWGSAGNNLGGNVNISVKKLQDCRRWPCTDTNSSLYNSTSITVGTSSAYYWSGNINTSYIINLTPASGSWGTGYWQVVLDVNGTETGSGWFNTIAFYVELQPTDSTGNTHKYSIKNSEPMYFKATTVRSQKNGWYYTGYNWSDYLNTTIDNAVLRRWDETTWQQREYDYPTEFNITLVGGGTVINGTRVLNLTYVNGSWPSGYYSGELTLKNDENETATGWLWFQARPFRVQVSSNQYEIDNTVCVNGTIHIYDPDWSSNTVLNGTYTITSITERVWTASGSSLNTYTNYTPSGTFEGSSNLTVCYNGTKWPSGSWGNYHYLYIAVEDSQSNSEQGYLSFRTVPFAVRWGSIAGGTTVSASDSIVVPVNLSKASSGAGAAGNLTRIYQWRWDNQYNGRENYEFSIGNCNTSAGATSCMVNGTQNVTIYAPSNGWKTGSNYLYAEWAEADDLTSIVQDWSGVWFNGVEAYNGWWNNADENGNWKYYFTLDENVTLKLYVRDSSSNAAAVNVTKVEYSTPSTTCWDDYCRTYNNASYSIVGQSARNITDNAIIKIIKPGGNWSNGYMYVRATVSGADGIAVINSGSVYVKDLTGPTVNVTSPTVGQSINTSSYWINTTTTESASCYIQILDYNTFYSWYCSNWNSSNSSNSSTNMSAYCDNSTYNSTVYHYDWIDRNYRSWNIDGTWQWQSASTGLVTGGTSHYYQSGTSGLTNQDYGIQTYCYDEDWNYGYGYSVFTLNAAQQNQTNVTLVSPTNGQLLTNANVTFNFTVTGQSQANCSLYGNFSSSWALNTTSNVSSGANSFNLTLADGGYLWNVYCADTSSSNYAWGAANWTFSMNSS